MKTSTMHMLLPILDKRIGKALGLKDYKKSSSLSSSQNKIRSNIKGRKAIKLLQKLGYKDITPDPKNTSLYSVESHVAFRAKSKRGRTTKSVVVFLTNLEPKSIVQQKNPHRPFSWLINGQAHKNSENIPF